MGFFQEEVCLRSGFDGLVTYQGDPVAGASIRLVNEYLGKEQVEIIFTDDDGVFHVAPLYAKKGKFSLNQFVSYQEIFVKHGGKDYRIWGGGKLVEDKYSEFNGKPGLVTCELTEEVRTVELEVGFIGTNCRWSTE